MDKLTCTLCENRCPLDALGCPKGQRFYEKPEEPYCTLCDNHCLLSNMKCEKGMDFYRPASKERKPIHFPQQVSSLGLGSIFELSFYQFRRIRGGMSSQMRVMRFLRNHGAVTQNVLFNALGIKANTLSEMVSRMEEQGLLERQKDNEDQRKKLVCLTEKGMAVFKQQEEYENQLDIFAALSPQEQEMLQNMLVRLSDDWQKRESEIKSE